MKIRETDFNVNTFITEATKDPIDKTKLYQLLALSSVKIGVNIERHLVTAVYTLLMAITRQRNCSYTSLSWISQAIASWLGESHLDVSIADVTALWNLIENSVKKIRIENIVVALTSYTEATNCVALTPLPGTMAEYDRN